MIKLICIWWPVSSGQLTNEIKPHVKSLSYHDSHRNDTCPSHMAASNEESHVAMSKKKQKKKKLTWKFLIKWKNKLNSNFNLNLNSKFVINSQYIPRENSKSNAIELLINKGFSYEKKKNRNLERKTILILRVRLDRTFFAKIENWKHCSKIIFKCVNSAMRPIFNEKVVEKWSLWVREQCT